MRNEIWKPIKGFEGSYEVSTLGNVRSVDRVIVYPNGGKRLRKGRELSQATNARGYKCVVLCTQKTRKDYTVHRLVAQTHIPNPQNLPCVNHKDEITTNNNVNNLEWCTYKYNNNYGQHARKIAVHFEKPILQFDLSGNFIARYRSTWDAERRTGIKQGSICNVANFAIGMSKTKRRYLSAGGYIWRWDSNKNTKKFEIL